jgi:S-DNA-T family DNA segregation ATPase FtsK/SpoIIIE
MSPSPSRSGRRGAGARVRAGPRPGAGPSARKREAAGVLLAALGLFLGFSFLPDPAGREGLVGPLGAASFHLLARLFSWGGLLVPVLAVVWGVVLFRGRGGEGAARFSAVAGIGVLACLTAFTLFQDAPASGPALAGGAGGDAVTVPVALAEREGADLGGGGMLGVELAEKLRGAFGLAGSLIFLGLAVLLTVVFSVDSRPSFDRPRLRAVHEIATRLGRALLWTAGVLAAGAVWLVSWAGGLLGVLGVAIGAARSRRRPRSAEPARGPEARIPVGAPELLLGSGWPAATRPGEAPPRAAGPAPRAAGLEGRAGARPEAAFSPARPAGPHAGARVAEPAWEVPLELFDPPPARDVAASERELEEQGAVLIRKLADFNVRGEIVNISSGPVITQFEVEPAPGVKVNQIANLADDLALAMRAQRIRIVAPIPGKGAVGIEIPNVRPERVTIREILASAAFREFRGTLPFVLGKEISGTPIVTDLTRMPHLLIAGSTGSGKSVCINALLTSLFFRFSPAELRLILIDPKMLELSMYNDVPHLLHPVVTRPKDAATALKWTVYEMERRFELLAKNAVRNIGDFNARLKSGAELEGVDSGLGSADEPPRPLPYVVLVVDELADLMLTVQAEIEEPLARLAQKARAVGIHMVLATQRPSVNVLTGFIKANFPSRISFQVASKTDSRTVLDQNGAEALLGFGDMLFLPADRAVPIRIQGAHVSSRETEALVQRVRALGEALLRHLRDAADAREISMRETIDLEKVEGVAAGAEPGDDRDELFFEAARVVIEHDQGSTSLLQRRLKVGYSRAARIVDQLERSGIVGPAEGSKPREVRIGLEELAEMQATAGGGTHPPPRSTIHP